MLIVNVQENVCTHTHTHTVRNTTLLCIYIHTYMENKYNVRSQRGS